MAFRTETSLLVFTDFPGPPETRAEDVFYIRLRDDQFTLHWEPYNDKLSELIICVRFAFLEYADVTNFFKILSSIQAKITVPAVLNHQNPIGFATKDLWERHPTIPGKVWHFSFKDTKQ